MGTAQTKLLSVTITRPYQDVYAFLADLKNYPLWASGLGKLRRRMGANEWLAETPDGGTAQIRLTPPNDFGIVDHYVAPEDADEIYIPMRVIRNGDGAEVIFTLFQAEGMTAAQFKKDEAHVRKDLDALKAHLEA